MTTSHTEPHQSLAGIILGEVDEYKTTISDGNKYTEGYGFTPEDSQSNASDDWKSGNTTEHVCYLTTACTKAMNLPDKCLELQVLRNFRDNVLAKTLEGKEAIKKYYLIAPEIVKAVELQNNSFDVWKGVYGDVEKAVSLVLSGKFNEAFEHYKQMTLKLKDNYLN